MLKFLDQAKEAQKVSTYSFFMAPFQAAGLMFANPKLFFLGLTCAFAIILGAFVYLGGLIIIPGILSFFSYVVFNAIRGQYIYVEKALNSVSFKFVKKIYVYNALSILPLIAIIASVVLLNNSFVDGKLTSPTGIYIFILAILFTLLWGNVMVAGVIFTMRKNSGILASCSDAIELIWKNLIGLLINGFTWFLELFFMFFLVMSASVVITALGISDPLVATVILYMFLLLVLMVFITHYLITANVLVYYIFEQDTDAEYQVQEQEEQLENKED